MASDKSKRGDLDRLLTLAEVADWLRVSPDAVLSVPGVRDLVVNLRTGKGLLPRQRAGEACRVRAADLVAWYERARQSAQVGAAA